MAWRELIESNPEIMGGTPVICGTRIPARLIATMLEQGTDIDEIIENYPSLKGKEDCLPLVLEWAEETPAEPPPVHPWHRTYTERQVLEKEARPLRSPDIFLDELMP